VAERHIRLIEHLLDELAVYDDNELRVERNAVRLFAAIHLKLRPEETPE
jgi:hypothetical protein